MPAKQIGGVELDPLMYNEYVKTAAEPPGLPPLKDAIRRIMQSNGYQSASDGPDGYKSVLITNVIQNYRQAAQAIMRKNHPGLRDEIITTKKNRLMPHIQ